jgi:hypothetical protein
LSSGLATLRPAKSGAAFIAALLALASPVHANCRFPEGSTDTPNGVAKLLFANSDALGFAVVRQAQDISVQRPEEIEMAFPLKGPGGRLAMRNPAVGPSIAVTNSQETFGAPAGTLVFAALRQTRSGWVIGECTAQLMAAFPLTILLPELRRKFLNKSDGAAPAGDRYRYLSPNESPVPK